MKLNLIETLKTSIYSQRHIQNTKIHITFQLFYNFRKSIFPPPPPPKNKKRKKSFMMNCMALFILLRATQPH